MSKSFGRLCFIALFYNSQSRILYVDPTFYSFPNLTSFIPRPDLPYYILLSLHFKQTASSVLPN
jgi:hypothetical protein